MVSSPGHVREAILGDAVLFYWMEREKNLNTEHAIIYTNTNTILSWLAGCDKRVGVVGAVQQAGPINDIIIQDT